MDVIQDQAHSLASLGTRDRSRWATLQEFGIVPAELRVDVEWLREIQTAKLPAEVVIELQPLLTAIDVEAVVRGITAVLSQHKDCQLTTTGQDYSGRTWFRGRIVPGVIAEIAMDFFSVQAMHSPLTSIVVAGKERPTVTGNVSLPDFGAPLPVVASLDTGVPSEHPQLASYRRGQFLAPNAAGRSLGIHGSHVASRIVFGNVSHDEIQSGSVKAECAFLDGQVAVTSTDIDEKAVMQALQGIRGAFPDVRVFNCSFSNRVPFSEMPTVRRDERKRYMRDLDNFVIRQ